MESLKNLLPNRNFTISPQLLFVGQFALVFGALTLGVLWLITPPPSPLSQVQTVATTSRSTTAPTLRPSAPASEVSDPEEQATTQASEPPAPDLESAAPTPEAITPVVSVPTTQTFAAPPPYIPSTPSTLTKTLAPPEELPELISLASNGTQKFAVLQLGNAVQTVGVADRIGSWQVQQIRSAQVIIQQGKRTLVLSFGGSTRTPSATSSNNNARPTPIFQPPSEENRAPQPPPQPPQVDNNPDGNPENENTIDR
ncbi:MAG: hypothetical protein H7Y37_02610 [Anaerolineae bacterium]|nr:hypothetical protein [Gloeobacterales cyanobacterium ES-bin-313]